MAPVLRAPENDAEITEQWLSQALQRNVTDLKITTIGVGESSKALRCTFKDPQNPSTKQSVVLKLAADKEASRKHGIDCAYLGGAYEREVVFFRKFGGKYPMVPACYAAPLNDSGLFCVVMEDFPDAKQADNLKGADLETAKKCLTALAELQGPTLGDWMWAGGEKWLQEPPPYDYSFFHKLYPELIRKFGSGLSRQQRSVFEWFEARGTDWEKAVIPPLGISHGDFRLDNVLFSKYRGTILIDWATVHWGPFARDLAYFMGTSLTTADRRKHGKQLFDHYMRELKVNSEIQISNETAWRSYVRETFYPVCMLGGAVAAIDLSDRGKEIALLMLRLVADQCLDVNAIKIAEEDIAQALKPLVPEPHDDGLHPIAPGENYNESYFFQAYNPDASAGFFFRYGRLPNQNKCHIFGAIMKEGHPTYQLWVPDAPLPDGSDPKHLVAEAGDSRVWWRQTIIEPLKKLRIQVKAQYEVFEDLSAPLKGKPGVGFVECELDMIFDVGKNHTHFWRITPRFEAPAAVKGTYTIAGERFELEGPGQRDHSWGMRDWFGVSFVGGDLHFDDGTHMQIFSEYCRLPCWLDWVWSNVRADNRTFQHGSRQKDGVLVEQSSCTAEEDWDSEGRLKRAVITVEPGHLVIKATPAVRTAFRWTGAEGRETHWPRTMCKLELPDGRKGVGLIEFFLVRKGHPSVAPSKTDGKAGKTKL